MEAEGVQVVVFPGLLRTRAGWCMHGLEGGRRLRLLGSAVRVEDLLTTTQPLLCVTYGKWRRRWHTSKKGPYREHGVLPFCLRACGTQLLNCVEAAHHSAQSCRPAYS